MDFLNRLLSLKERLGYSQKDLAKAMGVKPQALSNLISREGLPSTSALMCLGKNVTNVNFDWLLTGRGEMLHGSEQKQDEDEADQESVAVVMRYLQEQLRREDARREQIMQHYQTELEQTRKHYKEELDQAHKHFQEELKYYQSLYELSKRVMEMGERLNGVEAQLELKEQKRG